MTFNEALEALLGWVNKPIVVYVRPRSWNRLAIVTLYGTLKRAEPFPTHSTELGSDDTLEFSLSDSDRDKFVVDGRRFEDARWLDQGAGVPASLQMDFEDVSIEIEAFDE